MTLVFLHKHIISLDPKLSKQLDQLIAALEPVDTSKLEAALKGLEQHTASLSEATKKEQS